jgi:hypothetical protein
LSAKTTKQQKEQKETNNKRASSAKTKEKVKQDEKEKENKSKSSGSSSPSKASVKTASPVKTPSSPAKTPSSPSKTPATATPDEMPVAEPLVASEPPAPEPCSATPQVNKDVQMESGFPVNDNRMNDSSPDALPESAQFGAGAGDFSAKNGFDGFDDKQNGGLFAPSGSPIADEEEQPQPLPEPVHTIDPDAESPSGPEPDLIQDTFPKQSLMEQSQIFEDGIEPDYSGDAGATSSAVPQAREEEFAMESTSQLAQQPASFQHEPSPPVADRYSPEPEPHQDEDYAAQRQPEFEQEKEFSPKPEQEKEFSPEPEQEKEFSPEPEQKEFSPEPEQEKEFSPEPEQEKEFSPEREEEKEFSPEQEEEKEFSPEREQEKEFSPEPEQEKEFSPEPEQEKEFSPEPEQEKEFSPEPEQEKEFSPEPEQEKEISPEPEQDKEFSPEPEQEREQSQEREFSPDKEFSPEREEEEKEPSPAAEEEDFRQLQEPTFEEEHHETDGNNTIEQNIQYGVTGENGFQMGGIREEEEEDYHHREDQEKQAMMQQAKEMNRRTMEELGIYDEDDDQEKDSYVYEKDVNLDDEEVRMSSNATDLSSMPPPASGALRDDAEEHDQHHSNIPEAFEKDDTPPRDEQLMSPPAADQADSGREDTDSIDGGTPDDDKDIDEILAMQQKQQQQLEQMEEKDVYNPNSGQDLDPTAKPFNPFVGLGGQQQQMVGNAHDDFAAGQSGHYDEDDLDRAAADGRGDFDPIAQWGPPTGLPAPGEEFSDQQHIPQELEDVTDEDHSSEYNSKYQGHDAADSSYRAEDEEVAAVTDKLSDVDPTEFDPMAEWGHPMGLPSPPPDTDSKASPTKSDAKKDPKKAAAPAAAKTGAEKRPASGATRAKPKANGTAEPPKPARTESRKSGMDTSRLDTSCSARPASAPNANLNTSRLDKSRSAASATSRRPASSAAASKSRVSPDVIKMPPLPAFTPFYVDLTYIPNHGDVSYVDAEFFKRIRARYYVLSARNPNPKILELLIEAKAGWDKANESEVTVIPTYETQILQHWMAVHKEKLAEHKIDIAPAASRCTVRLQDHEASCYTYRLEF